MTTKKHKCFKCKGTGKTPFIHISNGTCFDCKGEGYTEREPDKKRLGHLEKSLTIIKIQLDQAEKESKTIQAELMDILAAQDQERYFNSNINKRIDSAQNNLKEAQEKYNGFIEAIEEEKELLNLA